MDGAVQYIWDEAKRAANLLDHGIDFTAAYRFDWDSAKVDPDVRREYGEQRFVARGWIGPRLMYWFSRRAENR